ncbi:citrate/2-methylcitrate synthase [Nocardioides humi]|uniref:citrate synthase (unknown stereospecificity) n=1 Tax=Nocardioides humi TaxID=449461 RepID=A0ABN2ABJ8_9ACTN|nr:citrate/2-methylcitrate synthase [Nocardioides humi]
MPTFHTRVSEVGPGSVNLRGYPLAEVMRELTYAEGAFLSIIGRLPTDAERRLVDVTLNSLLDHGYVASTITASRYIASGNPQFVPAVAGGLLAAGSNTLSPEHSYGLLRAAADLRAAEGLDFIGAAHRVVEGYVQERRRLPGFGHPVHKSSDFRADIVFEVAHELGLAGDGVRQFEALHQAFVALTGKQNIPINIDGALAAVGSDLGWSSDQTVAFALLSVLPGLMAHVIEEINEGVPLRYIEDGDYAGPPESPLPARDTTNRGAQ